MNAVIYEFPDNRNWQAVYKAAIVEVDSLKATECFRSSTMRSCSSPGRSC